MRCLALSLIVACALGVPASLAQQRTGAMEARPPPQNSAWVKLCETPGSASKDLFGKAIGARTCLTHHERLDGASGTRLGAVAVRQSEGRQQLTVMVPAGVERTPGVRVYIYPHNLWERVQRRERIEKHEEARLGVLHLKYAFCNADGCAAETEATPAS